MNMNETHFLNTRFNTLYQLHGIKYIFIYKLRTVKQRSILHYLYSLYLFNPQLIQSNGDQKRGFKKGGIATPSIIEFNRETFFLYRQNTLQYILVY